MLSAIAALSLVAATCMRLGLIPARRRLEPYRPPRKPRTASLKRSGSCKKAK
jgi:hypothetical protein